MGKELQSEELTVFRRALVVSSVLSCRSNMLYKLKDEVRSLFSLHSSSSFGGMVQGENLHFSSLPS